ncbi:hypothetical protein LguiA_031052 [Lonicera macranthoides]
MGTKTETAVARKSAKAPVTSAPGAKTKSVKAPKTKKSAAPMKPRSHPPYIEMIQEAILALKERTGSSQYAISKFIEEKQKENLPPNFKKLLLVQLKKLVASGKLTKVKYSFKLAVPAKPSAAVDKKAPAKKKVVAKAKVVTPVKAKKVVKKSKKDTKAVKSSAVKVKKAPAKGLKKPKSIKSPAKKSAVKKAKK